MPSSFVSIFAACHSPVPMPEVATRENAEGMSSFTTGLSMPAIIRPDLGTMLMSLRNAVCSCNNNGILTANEHLLDRFRHRRIAKAGIENVLHLDITSG